MFSNLALHIAPYARLMRLNRPIGFLLLLWPTLWGLWLAAGGWPEMKILIIFLLGVVVMRAAGCVINDIADRNLDGQVRRTKTRPLASGCVTARAALALFIGLVLIAFVLVLQLNTITIILAAMGVLLTIIYPFTKRFFAIPQLVLGIVFGGWPVLMGFAAVTKQLTPLAWLAFATASLWPIIYDTFYAMVDRPDDVHLGIHSSAIVLGQWDRLATTILQLLMLSMLVVIGLYGKLTLNYFLAIAIATIFAIYQQYLIKDRIPERCFKAFLNNHWFGMAIFLGLLVH